MASLTQTAILTRKIIRYSIYGVLVLIVLRVTTVTAYKIYRHYKPVPPPAPTLTFGRLPKIAFPQKEGLPSLEFSLETPDGTLPKAPLQAKVFFMPRLSAKLLSLEETRNIAANLGYPEEERQITETLYRFKNPKTPSFIDINIATGFFSVSYDFKSDPTIVQERPASGEIAISQVKGFLSGGGVLEKDLDGPSDYRYLKLEGDKFVAADSLSSANFVKVNIFRKEVEKLPVVTADTETSNVWFIVSGSRERGKQIITGEYHYLPIDYERAGTYPLKTTEEAWTELASGGGYIASIGANTGGGQVKIRRVKLGYYDPGVGTEIFQPVFIFEGDKGLIAYVPAVTNEFYGE